MKTLNRLLLVGLSVTLVAAVVAIHANITEIPHGHDTYYTVRYPWLHHAHQISLFGVIVWCVLFVRSEPVFTRIGLVALLLSFTLMALPPKVLKDSPVLRNLR